jgi:hypothetical protein
MVGCGFTMFSISEGIYNNLFVCNYGPGGNYVGGSMYKVGAACTECPATAPVCEESMCEQVSSKK